MWWRSCYWLWPWDLQPRKWGDSAWRGPEEQFNEPCTMVCSSVALNIQGHRVVAHLQKNWTTTDLDPHPAVFLNYWITHGPPVGQTDTTTHVLVVNIGQYFSTSNWKCRPKRTSWSCFGSRGTPSHMPGTNPPDYDSVIERMPTHLHCLVTKTGFSKECKQCNHTTNVTMQLLLHCCIGNSGCILYSGGVGYSCVGYSGCFG